MDFLETLVARSASYPDEGFASELKILPSKKIMLVGCVDPRVDPMDVLRLEPGEAAVIRNVGGRVNPQLLETIEVLGTVSAPVGQNKRQGWHLILLQHTDCGIKNCYRNGPDLLAKYLRVSRDELDEMSIDDPRQALKMDVASLRQDPAFPPGFTVSGLMYDVETGRTEVVVAEDADS